MCLSRYRVSCKHQSLRVNLARTKFQVSREPTLVSCVAPAGIGFVTVAVASNGQDFQYSVSASDSVQLELKERD